MTRDHQSNFEKHQILVCWQGGDAPVTPINAYLGGGYVKIWPLFTCQMIFLSF